MSLGEKLKALRTAKKMSQKELAERIGIAKSVISFYESGDRFPSYDVLIKIARIFNVTTDYLLGNDKNIKDSARNSSVSDKIVDKILNVNKSKDTLSSLKKKFG